VFDEKYAFPESIDAAAPGKHAGARELHLLFEDGDSAALDSEHVKEIVPEALRLRALGRLALPLAGEG
jgi:hypothetical protein